MSVFTLDCRVEIGGFFADFANEISIEADYKNLGSRCTIKLPRKLTANKQPLTHWLTSGQPVKVYYGYDGNLALEFEGYVAGVKPGVPVEVVCEDAFWLLRQKRVELTFNNTTVRTVLETVLSKAGIDMTIAPGYAVLDNEIAQVQLLDNTPAQVLEYLKKVYGIYSWFKGKEIHLSSPYLNEGAATLARHKYALGVNVISYDLERVKANDMKVQVVITARSKTGKSTIKVSSGDPNGTKIDKYLPGKHTEIELKRYAADLEKSIRYDGLVGKLTGFNIPRAQLGDWAVIEDPEGLSGQDYNGTYSIVAIKKSFGVGGVRREVTLGPLETGDSTFSGNFE